jgi:hypothetical protein
MNCLRKLCYYYKKFDKNSEHLRALLKALEIIQTYQLVYVDLQKYISDKMGESVTDALAN